MQNKKEQQNKHFNKWNKGKKELNSIKPNFHQEREICCGSLGTSIGFEEIRKAIRSLDLIALLCFSLVFTRGRAEAIYDHILPNLI